MIRISPMIPISLNVFIIYWIVIDCLKALLILLDNIEDNPAQIFVVIITEKQREGL